LCLLCIALHFDDEVAIAREGRKDLLPLAAAGKKKKKKKKKEAENKQFLNPQNKCTNKCVKNTEIFTAFLVLFFHLIIL
jgi:hypothetical protein